MWSPLDERFQPPSEPRVSAKCAWCGGEIYVGEGYTRYANGSISHMDACEDVYVAVVLGIERVYAD